MPDALLAQVPPEARNKSCICRDCVTAFHGQKQKHSSGQASLADDFYLDMNGLMVFTGAYLRRRGYCCDSGCRHCPYD